MSLCLLYVCMFVVVSCLPNSHQHTQVTNTAPVLAALRTGQPAKEHAPCMPYFDFHRIRLQAHMWLYP